MLLDEIRCFNKESADPSIVINAGTKVVKLLYGQKNTEESLNVYRYRMFKKSSMQKAFNLSTLPPTEASTALHCLRVYYQLRQWAMDTSKNPMDWGWELTKNGLLPITTTAQMMPDKLLKIISCNCSRGCATKKCSCKKLGIVCTILCKNCEGKNCANILDIDLSDDDDNDMIEDILVTITENQNVESEDSFSELSSNEDDVTFAIIEDEDDDVIDSPPLKKLKK